MQNSGKVRDKQPATGSVHNASKPYFGSFGNLLGRIHAQNKHSGEKNVGMFVSRRTIFPILYTLPMPHRNGYTPTNEFTTAVMGEYKTKRGQMVSVDSVLATYYIDCHNLE